LVAMVMNSISARRADYVTVSWAGWLTYGHGTNKET
jgi:hypothetical protein